MPVDLAADSAMGTEACDHPFYVIGLGLTQETGKRLSEAFRRCILYPAGVERQGATPALCAELGGDVIVFIEMLTALPYMQVRVSTVFDQQAVKVIGLHPQAGVEVYDAALQQELSGVLDPRATAESYRQVANAVCAGELWFPRAYLSRRLMAAGSGAGLEPLSDREGEIMQLLSAGSTNQKIAELLFVSRETVRWHMRAIYRKLGVSSREAARIYARNWMRQRDAGLSENGMG